MMTSQKVLVFHLVPERPLRGGEESVPSLPDGSPLAVRHFNPSLYQEKSWAERAKLDRKLWKGCGVGVIGVYTSWNNTRYLFNRFSLRDFARLAEEADEILSFSSLSLAENVLFAHGCKVQTTYDLYYEGRKAAAALGRPLTRLCKGTLSVLSRLNLGVGLESSPYQCAIALQQAQRLQRALLERFEEGTREYEEAFRQYSDFRNEVVHDTLSNVMLIWYLYHLRHALVYPTPDGRGSMVLQLPERATVDALTVRRALLQDRR